MFKNYNHCTPLKRISEYKVVKIRISGSLYCISAVRELWMSGDLTGSVNQGNHVILALNLYFSIVYGAMS
jgi:hypothetical protein